jgi:hypothetical protein
MTVVLPIEGNRVLLRQGMALLEGLTDGQYAEPVRGWAPVGAQYRHVLEHYQSFLGGRPLGRIDYDDRPRNERLESSRPAALEATRACLAGIDALEGSADDPVVVQLDSGAGPDRPDWRASSVGRELQFLSSHTVHHFALIKLLLDGSATLEADFGMAPSTIAHQRTAVR